MKKATLFISIISIFLILVACSGNESTTRESEQIADKLNPNNQANTMDESDKNQKLGYVRYSKDEIGEDENPPITMDRNQYADMITRIILDNDGFNEVATLVTDQEVLIAYDKNDDLSVEQAADIAKRTAKSIMPGFFDIYVSDNESLMYDIQSLHNSTTNRQYDNTVNQLIGEMKKSPQGLKDDK